MTVPLGGGGITSAPPHFRMSPARLSRSQALVRAYELVELAQAAPRGHEVAARLDVARRNQWWDVVHVLHVAALLADGGHVAEHLGALTEAAQRSGDVALEANALAVRAAQGMAGEQDLARAVVLLDDLAGSVVHRPAAYVSCFIAFARRGLTELAEEMLDRATHALDETWPPGLTRIAELTRRVVVLNRHEALLPRVCLLIESGERDQARTLARTRYRVPDEQLTRIPAEWQTEQAAVSSLYEAIAQEQESVPAAALLSALAPVRRQGYRALAILGQSIRRLDEGDRAGSAALAETALLHDDIDSRRLVTHLGLYLAAQSDVISPGWRRYAEHQARQRLATYGEVLHAARAELQAARAAQDTERSHRRAYVDELTGLANRHAYKRSLTRLLAGSGNDAVSVIMVDIDHFKKVNDRFGHAVGDEVLRRVGSMLADLTRATDLAVRLGGDEFLLLLTGRGPMDVVDRTEGLVHQVAGHDWARIAGGLAVTVSAGLSTGFAKDIGALVDAADRHLYAAKSGGRGRLVHDDGD